MSDATGGDVERHFSDLEKQLLADGFEPDSQVMKTATRLSRALKADGFSLTVPEEVLNEYSAPECIEQAAEQAAERLSASKSITPQESVESVESEPDVQPIFITRAFRARTETDSKIITSMFSEIGGWKVKTIQHNGNHYIVASNSQTLTDSEVKTALRSYVSELKAAEP